MKTIRKIMALALVLCMAAAMGVWNTDAHADWYTVQFNKLDNRTFENIPTGVTLTTTAAAPASAADTPASTTAGAAADPQKPGQLEWFYNPWAGTLVIRGRGAMVGFDEKHPAPWHNESKRALRVIIDEGVTTISNEAFKDFIYLRSVVFPSTLKGISATAFEKCERLKRVEVVTEIKDAEKLIEAGKSEELLMDDVKIIRVTKEAVRREICWLTTYWWDRVEIYRDRAGRPIRIIEHKCDGSTVDTGIKYLNEATAVNEAKDPDTVERSYSVTTTRRGEKSAKEKEVNEYGVALVSGQYDLNKNGRQVSGTELTRNYEWTENPTPEKYYEVEKRTLDNAAYYSDGSGTKNWTRVNSYGETEKIIEQVDKNDRILSVSSVTYDDHGIACRKSETKNSYNDDGNKTATQVVQTDANGNVEDIKDTRYSYNGAKQLTSKIEETKDADGVVLFSTESSYAYDKDGNLRTATDTQSNGTTEVTNYSYTDKGKKTASTTTKINPDVGVTTTAKKYDDNERVSQETVVYKAQDGTVYSAESTEYSYNSDHVVSESIKTTTNPDGSEATSVCSYDANGQMTTETRVDVNSEGKTQTVITSYTYDSEGRRISEKQESIDPEGKTSTYSWTKKYDGQGREIGFDSVSVESDGSTYTSQRQNIYDALGRVVYQSYEDTDAAGKKIGNIRTYTYHEDGTYDETDTPIGEPVVLAAKLADSSEETAGALASGTATEGGSVLADTSLNAQPSGESQVSAGAQNEETPEKLDDASTDKVIKSTAEDEQQGEKNTSSDAQNEETKEVQDSGDDAPRMLMATGNEGQKAGTDTEDTIPGENETVTSKNSTLSDTKVFSFKAAGRGLNIRSINLLNEENDLQPSEEYNPQQPEENDPPTNETPTNEQPTNEQPTNETPTNEQPTNETPTSETPTNEQPTNEPSAEQPPVVYCTCGDLADPDETGHCRVCHRLWKRG